MTFVAWPVDTTLPPPACNCTDGNTLPSFHCSVRLYFVLVGMFVRNVTIAFGAGAKSNEDLDCDNVGRVVLPVLAFLLTSPGRRSQLDRGPNLCSSFRTSALVCWQWIQT